MFTHMIPVKRETYLARGLTFELLVYQVDETGEYRIYVNKGGDGVGDVFTAGQDIVENAKQLSGVDLIAELVAVAKADIDRNDFGLY
ncbi:hypothetical protein [Burkholderia pyrrocinia]|uniref:hypothetical protein n=1 Tax=Burkholderia pyrrocinia TaxID=60550 RepID=UPI00158A65E8|nr:hypothetical protein [Burkholderia pyrrocinia]